MNGNPKRTPSTPKRKEKQGIHNSISKTGLLDNLATNLKSENLVPPFVIVDAPYGEDAII